jgi:DNA helicase II / ATP-dependent DNA helicase PcrA
VSALTDSIADLKTNPRQWQAFTTEGNCVVLAPPGSGKTKLLTTRMAHDLLTSVPLPHGAACITLTNAAADELRRRVDRLGVPPRSTLFVGTVHAFALRQVLIPFAAMLGMPQYASPEFISASQKNHLIETAIADVFGRYADVRFVSSTVNINRQRLATPEQWSRAGPEVTEVARRYEDELEQRGLIDFQKLVRLAVEFVEDHSAVRKVLAARYPHLYVDEYQDLAPGLDRLVRAMCFNYYTDTELFAVGDPDQAILAFTGTRPELLEELANHSMVTPVRLETNYRCHPEIVAVANRLWRRGSPLAGPQACVTASVCRAGFAAQCAKALAVAQQDSALGVPLHQIAVICPNNYQCRQAANVLRQGGLPAIVRDEGYRYTAVTSLIEASAAWAVLGRESSGYRLGDLIGRYRAILGGSWTRAKDASLADLLLGYARRPDEQAATFVHDLLEIGASQALRRPTLADEAQEVTAMIAAYTSGALSGATVMRLADRARKTERVEVTTMQSSKGLEFDTVIILGVDEGQIPFFSSVNEPEKMAEERRKMYVSITRARSKVEIACSGFVEWESGRQSRNGPSRFLTELGLLQRSGGSADRGRTRGP